MTKITNEDLAVMMKEGFDEIHDKFATKDDLKEALKNHPTKDDLKEELSKCATKKNLDKRINEVLVQGDYSAQLMKETRTELAAATGGRLRHERKMDKISKYLKDNKVVLDKHETIIKKLELSSV